MKDSKKGENWSTSVRHYLTDGKDKFKDEAIIYLNLRDAATQLDVLNQVAHEATHLLGRYPEAQDEVLELLQAGLDKGG